MLFICTQKFLSVKINVFLIIVCELVKGSTFTVLTKLLIRTSVSWDLVLSNEIIAILIASPLIGVKD